MKIVPRAQKARIQKMIKKYSKSLANLTMYLLYTLFYIKIKKIFLFFLNPGTIGTIVKKASNTNEIGGRAHDFLYLFITYTKGGIQIP